MLADFSSLETLSALVWMQYECCCTYLGRHIVQGVEGRVQIRNEELRWE